MQGNPNKFQFIIFNNEKTNVRVVISNNTVLNPLDSCKLLGRQLMFSSHVATICSKAGRQIHALARLSKGLNIEGRLNVFQTF